MPNSRHILLIIAILLGGSRAAHAQAAGYAVGGAGAVSGFFGGGFLYSGAGGGELLFRQIAGVGGEVGMLGNASSMLTVMSVNGVVHVLPSTASVSPFLTGGYSHLSSGEGSFDAFNVAAGVDFRQSDHVGLRVEFRDHVRNDSRGTVQYVMVRAGIVFK